MFNPSMRLQFLKKSVKRNYLRYSTSKYTGREAKAYILAQLAGVTNFGCVSMWW